jgi:hypothetical protein
MKTKLITILTVGIILISTTSCGIMTGTTTKITFDSEPRGAEVILNNEIVGKTPTTVKLKNKTKYDLRIRYSGFQDYNYHFGSRISPDKTLGKYMGTGAVAGGMIGFGIGVATKEKGGFIDFKLLEILGGTVLGIPVGSLTGGVVCGIDHLAGGRHANKTYHRSIIKLHNNIFFYDFNTQEVTIINK